MWCERLVFAAPEWPINHFNKVEKMATIRKGKVQMLFTANNISESKLHPLYSTGGDYRDYFGVVAGVVW